MATATLAPPDRPVVAIPMKDINARTYNVRGNINPQTCVDLARRIRVEGLNNPVQVVPVAEEDQAENDGKPYRMMAGFRRYMAHRINGAETIDCRIYEGLSPAEQIVFNFTENIAREDLTLMQEAKGIEHLRALRSMTPKELGEELGKSPKWVQVRLWALDLEPEIQKDIDSGMIKMSHIEHLHALPLGEPRYAYVRQVKSSILKGEKPRKSLAKKNVFAKKIRNRTEIFELQDHIIEQLGSGSFSKLPQEVKDIVQALGWAAGEANDVEIFSTLRRIAKGYGLHYEIPESALTALQG